jgi:hypothetical protein
VSTFLVEAAVLLIVFPPLEFLIASRSITEGSQMGNRPRPIELALVMRWSAILSVACLIASVLASERAKDKGADTDH